MNTKLRKQFENIAEIKEMLLNNDELKWCDESKRYINGRVFQDAETGYINGALFGWIQSTNREGYKLVPVETLECAIGWFGIVENEWTGAADLSDDFKHVGIIQKMIGSCDEH